MRFTPRTNYLVMNDRPKIKLERTATDRAVEILGWTALLALWTLTIINYSSLPDTIPIHYNGAGQADGFGGKGNILTLPFMATVLFTGLSVLNRYPHVFNYPTPITKENAVRQYTIATRMIRYLKLIVVVIFGLIVLQTVRNVNGQISGLGVGFLSLIAGLIFIPLICFVIKSRKTAKTLRMP